MKNHILTQKKKKKLKLFIVTKQGFQIFNDTIQWNPLFFKVNKTCELNIAHIYKVS